jgi:hypothetical protein
MKVTFVRLIKNKEPVCVIFGIISIKDLFDSVDEYCDPFECEVKSKTIKNAGMGWPKQMQNGQDSGWPFEDDVMYLCETEMIFQDVFDDPENWKRPFLEING